MNRTAAEIIAEWRASNLANDDGELASRFNLWLMQQLGAGEVAVQPEISDRERAKAWLAHACGEGGCAFDDPNTGAEQCLAVEFAAIRTETEQNESGQDRRCNRCHADLCEHDNCTDWTCARACSACAKAPGGTMSEYDRLKQQKDAIVAREKAGQDRLREALQELLEASGEAHIEIDSVKAVRKMGRFLAAAEDAKKALAASAEQPVASQESEIWVRAKKLSVREHQTLVHISGGYTSDHNIWMNHEDVRSAAMSPITQSAPIWNARQRAEHIYHELSDPAQKLIPKEDFIAVVASHLAAVRMAGAVATAQEPAPTEPALPNNVPVEWFNGNPYVRADVYIRATAAPAKEPAQKWVREKAAQEDGAMISAGRLANNYEQCPKCLNVFPCQHGQAAREASHGE